MAVNPFSTHLALGCEDGIVRIFSIRESDGVLLATKRLDRIKSRPLSLAWGPPSLATPSSAKQPAREDDSDSDTDAEEEEGKWEDTYILVGCSDSSIRKLSLSTSRVTARMTTDRARGQRTLVWTVGVLR
jgi:U3 small nucleolar RNA-associated protein 4